jgi:anti-sigma B factor antagonist
MRMDLEIYQARSDLYFLLRGRIVLEECEKLKATCTSLINKGVEQVVVDLSKVDFIDSAGLGVLVGMKITASKNRARIVLLQPSKSVADILYISKLDGIFDILTGAEAEVFRNQIVQPENRIGAGADRPAAAGLSPDRQPVAPPLRQAQEQRPEQARPETLDQILPSFSAMGSEGSPAPMRGQRDLLEDHCRKALDFMKQGNYDMAVAEYQKAVAIDPNYLPALNNLAIVYEKQPSWLGKAIEQWETVLRVSQLSGDQRHVDRAQRHLSNLRRMSS